MKRILCTLIALMTAVVCWSSAGCRSKEDAAPAMSAGSAAATPGAGVQLDAAERERLRALGYLQDGDEK